MTDCRGREGEDAHRDRVRETLRFWKEGRIFTPEDLLSLAWSGKQPWVVKVEGEALQILAEVAALEGEPDRKLETKMGSRSLSAFITLIRLHFEGRWQQALEMIRHPEVYGPVGDVLDLGWTRRASWRNGLKRRTAAGALMKGSSGCYRGCATTRSPYRRPWPDGRWTWRRGTAGSQARATGQLRKGTGTGT